MSDDNDDWSEKTDLTRIEDLSEFLHEEDPELDEKLEQSEDSEEVKKEEGGDTEEVEDFFSQNDEEDDQGEDDNDDESFSSLEEETQPNLEIPEEFSQSDDNNFSLTEEDQDEDESEDQGDEVPDFNSFTEDDNDNNNEETEEDLPDFNFTEDSDDGEDEDQDEAPEPPELTELESPIFDEPEPSQVAPNTTHKSQENFQDLRDYGNAISYGNVTTGGNPPFSIILRNIIYKEDAEDIFSILKEFGVVTAETEQTTKQGLESGSLLISQISEYSAIFLAHKFRRFNLEIRIGLSEQLHHSKSYEGNGKGLVTKDNIHQNINEEVLIKHKVTDVKDIILVTTTNLNNFDIHRYLEVITSHTLISHEQLEDIDENEVNYHTSINHIYQELASQLKSQAFKIGANAVTGINYSLTPLPIEKDSNKQLYKVTCFGNAVLAIFKSVP